MPRTLPVATALHLPRVLFAPGALGALQDELAGLGVYRPLLVSDRGVAAAGLLARLQSTCAPQGGMEVFDAVTENPLFADVDHGLAMYRAGTCDGVVALGGGSVIDTAKFIALLATNPGHVSDYAGVPAAAHIAGAPLVAIPTTAGTGSEASPAAALHATATAPALGMNSRHLVPRLAVLDPTLTHSLPRGLTAATGIDALSHCIEGFLSLKQQPLGDAMALEGVALVARSLRGAVADGQDARVRADMMWAAFAGGASIAMGLGPAHAVALSCSDQGFPHGILSGIGLVATLDATAIHAPERISALCHAFGLAPGVGLSEGVATLIRDLGLPASLHELGYVAADVQALAQAAHRSHFNLFAPFHPSVPDYTAMLRRSLNLV
jgi:4-hydroxybutyrate dehydrogenase